MTKINQLESLKVLKAVVECGSFTAAAARLNMSAARVSKSIEHLERNLETVLFNRSTRQMQITDSGRHCYNRALEMINQWQDLQEQLVESHNSTAGNIRISAPMSWGLEILAPIVDAFMKEYPDITLDIQLSDQQVNVLEGQFDLVLRLTNQLSDSNLICRKITNYKFIACATPCYLAKYGEPAEPRQLQEHVCLMFALPGATRKWQFLKGRKLIDVYLKPHLLSNNSKLLHSALLSGRGIAFIPEFLVAKDLVTATLIPLLKDFSANELNLYSLRPSNRMPSHRLKIFHDYLSQKIQLSES